MSFPTHRSVGSEYPIARAIDLLDATITVIGVPRTRGNFMDLFTTPQGCDAEDSIGVSTHSERLMKAIMGWSRGAMFVGVEWAICVYKLMTRTRIRVLGESTDFIACIPANNNMSQFVELSLCTQI